MKMRKILVTMLIACACLTACGKEESTQTPEVNMNVPLPEELEQAIVEVPESVETPVVEEVTIPDVDNTTPSSEVADDTEANSTPAISDITAELIGSPSTSLPEESEEVDVITELRNWVNRRDTQSQQMNKPEIGEDYKIIAARVATSFNPEKATLSDFCSKVGNVFIQTTNGTICEINCNGVYTLGDGYYKSFTCIEDILAAGESAEDELWLNFVEEE